MQIGSKFLTKIKELLEQNQVFKGQLNNNTIFFIPYDGDRFLQFGKLTDNNFEYEQRFLSILRTKIEFITPLKNEELPLIID